MSDLSAYVEELYEWGFSTAIPGETHTETVKRIIAKAIATEARRAGTVKQGPVHEGAGPKDIAQKDTPHD